MSRAMIAVLRPLLPPVVSSRPIFLSFRSQLGTVYHDRVSPSRTLSARRAAALHSLLVAPIDKPFIVVTTVSAAMQKVPPRSVIKAAGFQAHAGQELKRKVLEAYLSSNGYSRASTVMEPGDFAIRGGLIDIYPPALDDPIRLDFFGDELESIRVFNVETQRTITVSYTHLTLPTICSV